MPRDAAAPPRNDRSFRGRTLFAGCLVALSLVACDVPTAPPAFESRWIVPAEETRFGVAELLPGNVSVTNDSSAFVVDFDPVSFSTTLGTICPPCAVADGFTVPKPAFDGTLASSVAFPAEVSAITVLDGAIRLQLVNGLNFDPLRPAAGVTGTMTVTVTDDADGDVLGTLVIDGATTAFGQGTTLTDSLTLAPTTVEGSLTATARVDSPAGDPVMMDSSLGLSVTATPTNIRVVSVDIDVAGRAVDLDPVSLDLDGVDVELVDRVVSGAFVLDVVNPFAVAADFQLSISGPTIATIDKTVAIGSASTTEARIDFTQAELRSFLGEPNVMLSGGAVIDAGAPVVTVSPGQELMVDASLDLTLRVGG